MSDELADHYNAIRASKQERHAAWNTENMAILNDAKDVTYKSSNGGESLLFRQYGMPKVDFYPSTGRWRAAGIQRTFSGGATAFLVWYRKQNPNPSEPRR